MITLYVIYHVVIILQVILKGDHFTSKNTRCDHFYNNYCEFVSQLHQLVPYPQISQTLTDTDKGITLMSGLQGNRLS